MEELKDTLYFREKFSKNLKRIMDISGKKQVDLINDLSLSKASVSSWVNGTRLPRMDKVDLLANYLKVKRSDLMGLDDSEGLQRQVNGYSIPVLGDVAAGVPIDAIKDIIDWEEIPVSWQSQGEYFALKIRGDSMEQIMESVDVVIVRRQPDVDDGDTAIVLINGDSATCKKIRKTNNGLILISTNAKYPPMLYTKEEVLSLPIVIVGKVVELRQKY